MIAEALGKGLWELAEMPVSEFAIWSEWFTFKAREQAKAQKGRGRR